MAIGEAHELYFAAAETGIVQGDQHARHGGFIGGKHAIHLRAEAIEQILRSDERGFPRSPTVLVGGDDFYLRESRLDFFEKTSLAFFTTGGADLHAQENHVAAALEQGPKAPCGESSPCTIIGRDKADQGGGLQSGVYDDDRNTHFHGLFHGGD